MISIIPYVAAPKKSYLCWEGIVPTFFVSNLINPFENKSSNFIVFVVSMMVYLYQIVFFSNAYNLHHGSIIQIIINSLAIMITIILIIYIMVIGVSALFNSMKWLVNSSILFLPLIPFMVGYYLIFGDEKKRAEALIICKAFLLFAAIYFVLVILIKLYMLP